MKNFSYEDIIRLTISLIDGFFFVSDKIFVVWYLVLIFGFDTIFTPIPITKNFLLFEVISSCKIPQIFLPFTNTSFGHLKDIFFLSQKCSITLEMITGLIIENSLNGG